MVVSSGLSQKPLPITWYEGFKFSAGGAGLPPAALVLMIQLWVRKRRSYPNPQHPQVHRVLCKSPPLLTRLLFVNSCIRKLEFLDNLCGIGKKNAMNEEEYVQTEVRRVVKPHFERSVLG